MAARVHPQDVRSAHQRMHHLVADAQWSDQALLSAVAGEVVPALSRGGPCYWIIDWRGFHHHASLCIAAYGFLMLERLAGIKKNAARRQAPTLSESFRPRGTRPNAAARAVVDRHLALQAVSCHRAPSAHMSVLL